VGDPGKRHRLIDLVGEVIPGSKVRVPLQVSDLALWHIRRHEADESEPVDIIQLATMFDGRPMILGQITHEPRGFLSDAEGAAKLVATDAVLAADEQPERGQPLFESEGESSNTVPTFSENCARGCCP
jgi:hypothetical protein